jgi:release factor glutamine methyltransferase
MSDLLSIPFSEVNLHLSDTFPNQQKAKYANFLNRLDQDEPLQYVLGETEFRDCRILCTPSALIPRPETEELIDVILAKIKTVNQPKVLDLCTGTGCIAIALFKELSIAKIDGIDAFEEVIDLARKNNTLNDTQVEFHQIDVLNPLQMDSFYTEDFDVWVSNPPYIPEIEKNKMEKNVLAFEPGAALFVPNDDPLLFYREIAISAQKGLKNKGFLFYEIHEDFGQETIDLLKELSYINIVLHADLQGKNRMISAQKY